MGLEGGVLYALIGGAETPIKTRPSKVPGMGHCSGGEGPYAFDTIGTLEKWREENIAPSQIMGSNPQSGLTRPLCPFPQYAEYDGSGSLADASNWSCKEPVAGGVKATD